MIAYYFALYSSIIFSSSGQILLKLGALSPRYLIIPLVNWFVLLGLCSYFIGAMFYIYSLKKIPLSVAFPSIALSYLLVTFSAHFWFHEPLNAAKYFALSLILLGALILTRA